MRELKKAIWICSAIQAVLMLLFILTLILNKVLSSRGIALLPVDNPWFVPIIYLVDGVGCLILITVQSGKDLKKIDPDAYEKMLFRNRFEYASFQINYIFGNNENVAGQNLVRTCAVSRVLIGLAIFVEAAIVTIVITWPR